MMAERERQQHQADVAEELQAIARRAAALPELDGRSSEDIIGYDESGVPR